MPAFVPWPERIDHVAASGDPRATETPICHECAEAAAVGAIVGDVWSGYHTILLCDSCAARWAAALDPSAAAVRARLEASGTARHDREERTR